MYWMVYQIFAPCIIWCIVLSIVFIGSIHPCIISCIIFLIHIVPCTKNIVHILIHIAICIIFFDTRLQYVSFFWYTNACVSKLFGVSNRVSNLADRVQRDVSKWARKFYFNRKVNIRSAYYSRKYRLITILEECFWHNIVYEKQLTPLITTFLWLLFWIPFLLIWGGIIVKKCYM